MHTTAVVESCAAAACEDRHAVSSCNLSSQHEKSMAVQPPVKKSRLVGDVDINSPDIQKLIHAKSAHTSLVDEVLYYPRTVFR